MGEQTPLLKATGAEAKSEAALLAGLWVGVFLDHCQTPNFAIAFFLPWHISDAPVLQEVTHDMTWKNFNKEMTKVNF